MKNKTLWLLLIALMLTCTAAAQEDAPGEETREGAEEPWLPTLVTETPEEGFELAVRLARRAVVLTQPDIEVLRNLRPAYAHDPDSLTAASQVVAIHFQTIAAANDYWRRDD